MAETAEHKVPDWWCRQYSGGKKEKLGAAQKGTYSILLLKRQVGKKGRENSSVLWTGRVPLRRTGQYYGGQRILPSVVNGFSSRGRRGQGGGSAKQQ